MPLLNVAAVAGLTPEAKDDIKTVVKTLMDTAQVAPAYESQQVWNYEKEASEGVIASVIKLVRLTKRLEQNAGEVLDRLVVMQMFHPEVQQYVRDKESKDPDEAASSRTNWTHKFKEEKAKEERSLP